VGQFRWPLTEEEWALIEPHLLGKEGQWGGVAKDNRLFVEAVIYLLRERIPWRKLPPEYGNWRGTYTRFRNWRSRGLWEKILKNLIDNERYQWLLVNGTVYRQLKNLEKPGKSPPDLREKNTRYLWPWMYMICRSDSLSRKLPKRVIDRQTKLERDSKPKTPALPGKHRGYDGKYCDNNVFIVTCKTCRRKWEHWQAGAENSDNFVTT